MTLTSPYLAAAPTDMIQPLSAAPGHKLFSLERELDIIPLKFTTTTGALATQKVTAFCWLSDQTGGVLRLHHPLSTVAYIYIGGSTGERTLTRTNTGSGYTDIDVGATTTGTFDGFIALRAYEKGAPTDHLISNAAVVDPSEDRLQRDLAGRLKHKVYSNVVGLRLSWYEFAITGAGGLPDSTTYKGSSAFHVERTGAGDYTISSTKQVSANATFIGFVENGDCVATQGTGAHQIDLVCNSGVDPADTEVVRVCVISADTIDGRKLVDTANTAAPPARPAKWSAKCMYTASRDQALIPFNLLVDGAGDILDAGSYIPPNVQVTHDSGTYYIEFGRTVAEGTSVFAHVTDTGDGAVIDYSELETKGRVSFTVSALSEEIHGFILAQFVNVR
jgi:hypothetical protein